MATKITTEYPEPRIEDLDGRICIHDLEIQQQGPVDYLQEIPEEQRESAVIEALEVGVFCLERSATNRDIEFVRNQIESPLVGVVKEVETIPAAVPKDLLSKLGPEEGVLAPIQRTMDKAVTTVNEQTRGFKEF